MVETAMASHAEDNGGCALSPRCFLVLHGAKCLIFRSFVEALECAQGDDLASSIAMFAGIS
jgi:hypothetical protein